MATTNTKTSSPVERAKATIKDIKENPDFEQHLRDRLPDAFSRSALALVGLETGEGGERSTEGHHLAIAAHVNGFILGNLELNRLAKETTRDAEGSDLSDDRVELTAEQRQRRSDALDAIIPFNHAVKEYIEQDPNATFCDTVEYVMAIFALTNGSTLQKRPDKGRALLDFARTQAREAINGMRHETAVHQLLEDSYHVDGTVSVDDDKKGCDLRVTRHGGSRTYSVDVKGSQKSAHTKREAQPYRRHAIIWSTLSDEDFTRDGFTLSPDTIVEKQPKLVQELEAELARLDRRR